MNPLSPATYYRRNKRRTVLLLVLISLVTSGTYLMGALLSTAFESGRSNYMFLSKFSIVSPKSDENGPDPSVIAQIRAHPDVERVIPVSTIYVRIPGLTGTSGFNFLGLMAEDMPYILEKCNARLKEGELPEPGTNGLLLSENTASSLELQPGDRVHGPVNPELYNNILAPLEVVGILESDVRLGIVSLEFHNNHELYRDFADLFLVVAREGRGNAVDDFIQDEIQTVYTNVQTFKSVQESINQEYIETFGVLAPSIIIVALAFALVIATANWVAYSRRLPEFGILHAMGFSRRLLIRHLVVETTALAFTSWTVGISISWFILWILDMTLFSPRGQELSIIQFGAAGLTIPLPFAVIGFSLFSIRRIISHLDPIVIIEQGELSQERNQNQKLSTSTSSSKPLATMTFYKRHKRRALLLISVMSMMIVAVVLIVFAFDVSYRAKAPALRYLDQVSHVRSHTPGGGPDPAVVAQVRTHPSVEKVIPVAPRYHIFGVRIPPFTDVEASPFGVYAADMKYLVNLYGLHIIEGQLPRPHTNQMVIPETIARNRGLSVGDVIGDPEYPAYPGANSLPTTFIISGIFAQSENTEEENWWGFVSLEFLEDHEEFSVPDTLPLFVVPKPGQKDELDDWLENDLAVGKYVQVVTYRQAAAHEQKEAAGFMLIMAVVECGITIVAAAALAVLNHIFISQRQPEFGILHALGFKQLQLVWRGLQETVFTTGTAWIISTCLVFVFVLYMRISVFARLGLIFDLMNSIPWYYTLPIPGAVLAATTATISWSLRKLDPVSIIERR